MYDNKILYLERDKWDLLDWINDLNQSLFFNKQMIKTLCENGKGEVSN